MNHANFEYVIYIRSTPEEIWNALITPETTRKYWEHENISDWKPGSPWKHQRSDETKQVYLIGEVLESVPPRRLVLTWAFPKDKGNMEKYSTVSIQIDTIDGMSRVSLAHEQLEPDSDMLEGITEGWPRVLSSLKSFLETGQPLPTWAEAEDA